MGTSLTRDEQLVLQLLVSVSGLVMLALLVYAAWERLRR
jgi:hypothetical protein